MIFIILHKDIYNIIIEYINSIIENIINATIVIYPDSDIKYNTTDIFIFCGIAYITYPIYNNNNVFYINLEQLTMNGQHSQYDMLTPLINFKNKYNNINLLDYSNANIHILQKYNIVSKYFPYQLNYNEIKNFKKTIDFILSADGNERKINIYNALHTIFPNSIFIGKPHIWGIDRDNILFKSKIIINIHHREKDYNILEEIRITRCILNKMIVISEYSENYELYPLYKYVIFTNYDNIINTCTDIINNYEKYYEQIYKNIDLDEIHNILKKYLEIF